MARRVPFATAALAATAMLAATACGSDERELYRTADTVTNADDTTAAPDSDADSDSDDAVAVLHPDVIDATAVFDGSTWTISATLSSPYDSPERYADAWRVVGPDGTVYGERILTHDHANEQPFTRSRSGIEIPADVETVTVEGRDQLSGWGGATFELALVR